MKNRFALLLLIVGILASSLPGLAAGQERDPLYFIRTTAEIGLNVQKNSLDGFLGVYVASANWGAASKDSDLRLFMKLKEVPAKADRSATCLFPETRSVVICVYFDGDKPFGVLAVKATPGVKIDDDAVAAAYQSVSKEMLKKTEQKLEFQPGGVSTDDGTPLPGYLIRTQSNPAKLF